MKSKHIISLIVLGTLYSTAYARSAASADTLTLTLEQCREMALSGNFAVRTAANDMQMAKETSKEAFTKYFPEISASGTSFWANHDVIQYKVFHLFELGIIDKGYTIGLTAVQPIFAGGQIANGNALAHVGEKVAQLRKRQTDDEIYASTDKYYWQLVSLQSQRATLASLITMLDTLAYQTQAAVDAGVILRNDLLRVELQRNDFKATMIDLDNGIALCANLLGQYIGAGLTPIKVNERVVPGIVPELDYEIWRDPEQAVTDTPDFEMLHSALKAAELEKKMTIGSNLPTVGLGAGWFFHNLLKENFNFGALFVAVNVPLSGWWGGSHAIKKKQLEIDNARMQLEDGQQLLQIAIKDAWDNLTAAYRKMQNSAESITQAEENLRLNENYYQVGVSNITDLLEAQTLYKQACDQFTTSYAEYRVCATQYLKATGQLTAAVSEA